MDDLMQLLLFADDGEMKRKNALLLQPDGVFCGKCEELAPRLACPVNLVVTSPPYAEQRKRQYGGVAEADYPAWTVNWMDLLKDKLADDGSVFINIRPHLKDGIISDYVLKTRLALRDAGWCECEELIWYKPDGPPLGSTFRPRRTWESVLWFSKTSKPFVDLKATGRRDGNIGFTGSTVFGVGGDSHFHGGQNTERTNGQSRASDVIDAMLNDLIDHAKRPDTDRFIELVREYIASVLDSGSGAVDRVSDLIVAKIAEIEESIPHSAAFPVTLPYKLILTYSREGDVVLDPFCGSGTTLLAAREAKRKYIGMDVVEEYRQLSLDRLSGKFKENLENLKLDRRQLRMFENDIFK